MDFLSNLLLGFATASSLANLGFCFIGALLGTLVGVLPGIGPTATIAMLLPVTIQIGDPVSSIIMLSGVYYGAQYGGSTTAILINLPGEASSAVTAIDGYQMARKGRAGAALAVAAIGSFFAGTVSTLLIAVFAAPLTEIALRFSAAEYCSLMIVGLVCAAALAHGSVLKALAMAVMGLLSRSRRRGRLRGHAAFQPRHWPSSRTASISWPSRSGCFGVAEILRNLENERGREVLTAKVTNLMPTRDDFRRMVAPILRGTALGSALGILPGGGAIACLVRLLHGGEAGVQDTGGVRQGRDRRRRRPGIRQQCRRPDLVHPHAHARHSGQSGDGADDRRDGHPGHRARSECRERAAGAVLGRDRLHVDRQSDASRSQPAADRAVGEAPDDTLLRAVPDHHGVSASIGVYSVELQRLRPLSRSPSSD